MKTRTVYVHKPGKIQVIERNIEPGPNDIMVKTYAASICGTDKNFFNGHIPRGSKTKNISNRDESSAELHKSYPLMMGHEGCGIVEAIGKNVTNYKVGDFVSSFYWAGTMGDYFLSPTGDESKGMFHVPKGISFDTATVGEPVSCAVYAGLQSGVELGDTVAIVGGGFAGQVIAQVVKRMGAYKVIVVDIVEKKLTLAKKLGADITFNPKNCNVVDAIIEETKGFGVDVAIETGGVNETLQICTDILKHGGILGLYSWILDPVNLFVDRWHDDGFDIRTLALMHKIKHSRIWHIEQVFSILAKNLIQVEPLITHSFSLADAQKGFETACNDAAGKVMLKP